MKKHKVQNNISSRSTNIERDLVRERLNIEMHPVSIDDSSVQLFKNNRPIKSAGKKRVIQFAKQVKVSVQQIIKALEKFGYTSVNAQSLISNHVLNELLCQRYIQPINLQRATGNIANIEFFDGYYLVWHISDLEHTTTITPLRISDENSLKCFNLLKKYLEFQIKKSFIIYYTINDVIGIEPILSIEKYIQKLQKAVKDGQEYISELVEKYPQNVIHGFRHQSKDEVDIELKCKNIFIDYLSVLHNYKRVYKCYEIINNQKEDCFIFSTNFKNGQIAVIFENITFARATEIFITTDKQYRKCIESIFGYFISQVHNKRELLRQHQITAKQLCAIEYHSIIHYDIQNWQLNINNIIIGHVNNSNGLFQFKVGLKIPKNVESDISSKEYSIDNLHNQILRILYNKLNAEYPNCVGSEIQITDNKRIDAVVKLKNGTFAFYEVKPYLDPFKCIQEGIGQLMNYKFLVRNNCLVSKLIVVGINEPNKRILDYIKMYYSPELPIDYMQIQLETKAT